MRLDKECLKRGLLDSRNKVQEFILKGFVFVNGKVCYKNSLEVSQKDFIELKAQKIFVSRAGEKLYYFLKEKQDFISLKDKKALDVGSSTGGFTQVLLELGAKRIVCVDVGKDQLHTSLKENEKVELHEKMDIRDFITNENFEVVVCDVSFISLEQILTSLQKFAASWLILLFKPQFEVGKEAKRNKKGVVQEEQKIQAKLELILKQLEQIGFKIRFVEKSKVKGKEGNEEFFIAAKRL
ncbi:TlyA family RNA methyltransferase [Helicobacter burdigaliensis]|uniref:23S rRNA (cytidine-2'-O)-methyltransferase TlyA n=1 Tax=Helicobacter burdigaliensis TaxID=2315334 RepID=UPI000EF6DE0D|nr:TlyA family RNA methyltransferase [Helicobacter burdigaliensis]